MGWLKDMASTLWYGKFGKYGEAGYNEATRLREYYNRILPNSAAGVDLWEQALRDNPKGAELLLAQHPKAHPLMLKESFNLNGSPTTVGGSTMPSNIPGAKNTVGIKPDAAKVKEPLAQTKTVPHAELQAAHEGKMAKLAHDQEVRKLGATHARQVVLKEYDNLRAYRQHLFDAGHTTLGTHLNHTGEALWKEALEASPAGAARYAELHPQNMPKAPQAAAAAIAEPHLSSVKPTIHTDPMNVHTPKGNALAAMNHNVAHSAGQASLSQSRMALTAMEGAHIGAVGKATHAAESVLAKVGRAAVTAAHVVHR